MGKGRGESGVVELIHYVIFVKDGDWYCAYGSDEGQMPVYQISRSKLTRYGEGLIYWPSWIKFVGEDIHVVREGVVDSMDALQVLIRQGVTT